MESDLRDEITPKNILMMGPTGVGKTEIARRLAKLADAPFVKVEATKFTEVGFHGRDVDQIIRDLVENAHALAKQRLRQRNKTQVDEAVEERLLDALAGDGADDSTRESMRRLLRDGSLEERTVEIEGSRGQDGTKMPLDPGSGQVPLQEFVVRLDKMMSNMRQGGERRQMRVEDARRVMEEQELERMANSDAVTREAISSAENDGIVFIDEIDKIVSPSGTGAPDASSEGVQRDLLPIIEGSQVSTKHGNLSTDHILFIASGAFHSCKPSDMLAELQGRLPVRVELNALSTDDLHRVLTEPEANAIRQHVALLATEGIRLEFTQEAIHELSRVASEVNLHVENIGARRLHTILERVVDGISYDAPDLASEWQAQGNDLPRPYTIESHNIRSAVGDLLEKSDLSRFVL